MRTVVFIFLFFTLYQSVYALRINEIYPAPPQGNFEWVELYNESDQVINLLDFELTDETGKTLFFATNSAQVHSYITATSSGVLNNSGDTVILKTTSGNEMERVIYPANIDSTHSYTFCEKTLWTVQTATQGSENIPCITASPTPTVLSTIVPTQMFTPTPTPYIQIQNIYLNEFMPNPSDGPEWVELYNGNDTDVSLTNWYIDDAENAGSSPYLFSVSIGKKSFATVQLKSAMLNNTGDTVRLLDPLKQEVDTINYTASEEDKSISKQVSGAWCTTNATHGYENDDCISVDTAIATKISPTPSKEPPAISTRNSNHSYPAITLSLKYVKKSNQQANTPYVLGASTAQLPSLFYFFALLSCASSCVSGSLFALQFKRK
ncbi:MAG: lamin tail domain-containing protein [Candidatus Roizmanbacteria bacterium]|nr:lamin tail domain-containing protein [Candidatus Roizmanbacteria bacterium]